MGTMIQNADLTAEDFGGEEYEGCNEYLNVTAPHIISTIHRQYLEASADLIETNTFGATKLVLDEYGLGHLAYELNVKRLSWQSVKQTVCRHQNGPAL